METYADNKEILRLHTDFTFLCGVAESWNDLARF